MSEPTYETLFQVVADGMRSQRKGRTDDAISYYHRAADVADKLVGASKKVSRKALLRQKAAEFRESIQALKQVLV